MDPSSAGGATVAVVLLLGVLVFAVVRPRGLPEVVAALPAALVVVALGLVPWADARHEIAVVGPTIGFLAAILVLAELSRLAGVFDWAGDVMAGWSRGSPQRLLTAVFAVAALTTAVLSLDATVVLLTPVVLVTATRVGARPRPGVYASTHLANTASTLLPVSNLTNLLAFSASGLTFAHFAGLMALPWLATVGVEYLVFRLFFAGDLRTPTHAVAARARTRAPVFALVVLAATLVGFAAVEPLGVSPAWVAAAGALVLLVRRGVTGGRGERPDRERPSRLVVRAVNAPFLVFVLALGIVVLAVSSGPVGDAIARLVPDHADLLGLLAAAALAAVLANLLNNLPATLLLVPLVAHSPGLLLAVLLGVNIGPNLTYVGSLATLLWRQVLHSHDHAPSAGRFVRLGLATVPACLVVGVAALWWGLDVWGA